VATRAPTETAGNVPPQNAEAEASVLGSILLTEQALDSVLLEVGLRPDDFYRPRHQLIFRSMVRLKEKAEPEAIDAVTLCDDLKRAGELDDAGGEPYVHSLPTVVIAAGNVVHYGRIVKNHAILRRLLVTTHGIQEQVMGFRGEPRELLERAEQALFRIGHDESTRELRAIEDVLHDEIDKLHELSEKGVTLTGTPSGFSELDEITGGFQPGNMIVIAARP
jgi:replicative DNA helicase